MRENERGIPINTNLYITCSMLFLRMSELKISDDQQHSAERETPKHQRGTVSRSISQLVMVCWDQGQGQSD
jgi:hypothetical protein